MEHKLAMDKQFAERYLLGELTDTERDAYEEHFFECQVCAEEVQTGSQFIRAARDVFAKEPVLDLQRGGKSVTRGRFWKGLFQPAPAMAFAAVVLVSGLSFYQQGEISRLKRPQIVSEAFPLRESRGMRADVNVRKDQAIRLEFDVPPGSFASYKARVLTEAGAEKASFSFSAQQAKDPVQVMLPAGSLKAGSYSMVIQGVNSGPAESMAKAAIVSYPFTLQLQD